MFASCYKAPIEKGNMNPRYDIRPCRARDPGGPHYHIVVGGYDLIYGPFKTAEEAQMVADELYGRDEKQVAVADQ